MASILLLARGLFFTMSFFVLMYAGVMKSSYFLEIAIGCFGVSILTSILQWIFATQTKCPLCITPVLSYRHCSKNRKAKKLLGSYRMRVATNILTRNYFRCPYCSEPTVLEVRPRRHA